MNIIIKNVSKGRRPEWVAVVREGKDVRTVYLASDLIDAMATCRLLFPNADPDVRD